MSERFDVVVVGSGAGGGVVAGELADRGRTVLLLECGPHRTAADFTRWEAKANHDFWWPVRFAPIDGGARRRRRAARRPLRRRHDDGEHEGRAARRRPRLRQVARRERDRRGRRERRSAPPTSTRTTTGSRRASVCASAPTGRRASTRSSRGFRALGVAPRAGALVHRRELHELRLVPAGLPDERRQVDAQHLHPRRLGGGPPRAARRRERRARRDRGRRGARGRVRRRRTGLDTRVDAGAVVVAAGTLNTPQLLLRSGLPDSPSSRLIGRNLGFHPVRLVYGLFDEPQDAHMVYPITAHAMDHQRDEDGGFVIEATTIQDPISFATTLEDENGPLWGQPLVDAVRRFRHWVGVLAMVNDDNNGVVALDEDGRETFSADFEPAGARAPRRSARVLTATCSRPRARRPSAGRGSPRRTCRERAGWAATRRARSSTPMRSRGTCGGSTSATARSIPRTMSVNPSLTIMALADRLADPPRRRPARVPRDEREAARPRAPLARRAVHAEAGREPPLLHRDPRDGGRGRERRLGVPALLR